MPTSLIPQLRHAKVETYLQTGTCLSVSIPLIGWGEELSQSHMTINCRVWLPHMPRIVSRCERSTLTSRDQHVLSPQSMLLTTWMFTCIGVLHISNMYASCIIIQVSLSLLRMTPNTPPGGLFSTQQHCEENSELSENTSHSAAGKESQFGYQTNQYHLHLGYASAKCQSVLRQHATLPDTPGDLSSGSKYIYMLPDRPGATQCALRLCKSILRCSWKHL